LGDDENKIKLSEELKQGIEKRSFEVLIDDRNLSPGAKFKDADLIGIPLRITLGRKIKDKKIELKLRNSDEQIDVSFENGIQQIFDKVEELLQSYNPMI
jgi:prolyl-tRNA synthetase